MNSVQPGWYPGMPMADYLAIPAMSASGIELFRRSPAHFRFAQENPSELTPAMREGTALHLALLEPELFEGRYIALQPCEAELKSGKRKGEPCGLNSNVYRDGRSYCGKHDPSPDEPISDDWMGTEALERIAAMKKAVLEHPTAKEYFRGRGCSELVGVWRDPETGVLCKIRLDRKIDRAEWIHTDIKTTANASMEKFARQVGTLGYHRKAAWYRRGMKELGKPATASVLVAVENVKPHLCATFILDEGDLNLAGAEIQRHLRIYQECLDTGVWPGYAPNLQHLKVKPWDLPEQPKEAFENEWDEAEAPEEEEVGAWG